MQRHLYRKGQKQKKEKGGKKQSLSEILDRETWRTREPTEGLTSGKAVYLQVRLRPAEK